MRRYLLLSVIFLLVIIQSIQAQCPPPGFPQPGNTCVLAPILCPTLDGYCATINNSNTAQNFPGCPGWSLNNDEWFGFFAGSTTISMTVTPSNCSAGANQGLQGGIYAACVSQPMDLQCSCTTNPFVLTASNFVVGQIYYMVLDGCSGNVCDYSIDVTVGSTVGVPPNPPGPITGPATICAGTSGAYSIAPVPVATSYVWTLNPPVGTVTSTGVNATVNIPAGATTANTQLCVTAANACYSNLTPSCIDIDVIPRPTATITGSGALCSGTTGNIDLTVTFTGEGPWRFIYTRNGVAQPAITTSSNPYTLSVTQIGTYALQSVVTTVGALNCAGTVSGSAVVSTITVTPTIVPTASTCLLPNGAANLSVTGGTAPYTFIWSNGATTEDLSNIVGGMPYTVTVTSNNGCTATISTNISNTNPPIAITSSIVSNTTCLAGNGSITVNATPAGSYTYDWSNGGTTNSITNLEPGPYTVTVSAGGACTQSATFNVPNAPNIPSATLTTTPTTCQLPNGAVNLSVSGGVAPYTFSWGSGETTEDLANVPSGPYAVTVTGANGCTTTTSTNLTNSNPPFTITPNVVANTTCNGGNGSVSVSVAPAGVYTYLWDTGETTSTLTGLTPGGYSVVVSAGGACTGVANITIPNTPNLPTVSITPTNTTCELANGSLAVSVSGGVAPYTFEWDNGATTQNLIGQLAGTYSLTVTGANGCTRTASSNISNTNPPITITPTIVPNTTCNGGNGSVSLSVTPPFAGYTYLWDNGAVTSSLTGLPPGPYAVTVFGAGACSQTATINIPDIPNLPNVTATTVQSTCELNNGTVNVNVNGGVAPYTFSWSNGAVTQNLAGIAAGGYDLTVTGANGCTRTISVTVNNNNPNINVSPNIVSNTSCNSSGTGAVSLSVLPIGAYTYIWNTGATTNGLTNLVGGSYQVTVSAGGACTRELDITIPDDPNEPVLSFNVTDATCGRSNGAIDLSVSGGTLPFTYTWASGQITQDLFNIPPDIYIVTVTGSNGCSSVDFVTVDDNPINININSTVVDNNSCTAIGNGSIAITVAPAIATVLWSNGSILKTLNNLLPGDYTVTVTVGGTCIEIETFTIFDDSEAPDLSTDVTEALCGLSNGAINLTVFGSFAPYTYQWSNGAATQDLTNKLAGDYTVTVTTSKGCTAVAQATIPNNDPGILVLGTVFENTSCALPNGTIYTEILPTGYSYTYKWSTGAIQPNLLNIGTGFYTVTVTLGTCVVSETIEMTTNAVPPNLAVSSTAATCGVSNGTATANANAGVTPYTYKWSNLKTTAAVTNLAPGTYTVTVTGANGCSATASVSIPNNTIVLNITGSTTANNSCVSGNGAIDISISPAGAYTYSWSNTATTQDITALNEGTYTVTVTAGPTCTATANFTVNKNTTDPVIIPVVTADICSQNIGAIDLTISSAIAPYSFNWSNTAVTEDISGIASGTFTVTVTAANGCTATEVMTVANNSNTFSLSGVATPLTNCVTNNGAANLTITPAGAYQILWSTAAVTEDLSNLTAGSYTVTITQSGSCTASLSFVVLDERTYPDLNRSIVPDLCSLGNGAVTVTINGGTAPFTYLWSDAKTTQSLTNITGGTYTLTVTDINGCSATTTAVVPNNAVSFTLDGTTLPNTACGVNNGSIALNVSPVSTYTYLWNNGVTTQDLNTIDGGDYSVTVSAGGTCTNVASFVVVDNTLSPLIVKSATPAFCGKSNGGVNLTVSGSTTPYTYLWNTSATTAALAGIPSGTYTVTVTGANDCTTETTVIVPDNAYSPTLNGVAVENTSCTAPNGSVNVTVTPIDNYTFIWDGGQTTASLSALSAGTYTVTVSAGGACSAVSNFTVGNNTVSPVITNIIAPSVCSQPTGSVNITVSTGVSPFVYKWSNNATTEDISGLLAGTYTVTVTGANSCTATASFVVTNQSNNFAVSAAVTPNSSCAAGNGGINLTVVPFATYTYKWSNNAVIEDIAGLLPGTYSVTVTDATGCSVSELINVTESIQAVTLSGVPVNILCFGDNSGSIDITVETGSAGYSYNWQPVQAGNPQDLTNIKAGNYALTVTDSKGCTTNIAFAITQPTSDVAIDCDQSKTISVPGATDGEGTVNITGGTPPYKVDWSPGSTTNNLQPGLFKIQNLAEGTYAVTVTDANGCSVQCGFNIGLIDCMTEVGTMASSPLSLCGSVCATAVYNNAGQFLDPDDLLQFILHEGGSNQIVNELARNTQPVFCFNATTMTYGKTYYISAVAGNSNASGVILSDFCTVVAFGTPVVFNEVPVAAIVPPLTISCARLQVDLTGSSSIPGSVFTWTTSGSGQIIGVPNQAVIKAGTAGFYRLITTANGCSDTLSVGVSNITNQPQATISVDPNDILDCIIDQVILSGTVEGTTNANIIWMSNGAVFSNNNPVPTNTPGTYQFIVVDTLSACSDTAVIVINQNKAYPPLTITPPEILTCAKPQITLIGGSPFAGILFKWARIANNDTTIISNTANAVVNQPGTYYLIGLDPTNTCTNIESIVVTANQILPVADAGVPFTIDCFGEIVPLNGSASGNSTNLLFNWTTTNGNIQSGNTTLTPIITLPGTYLLLVTDNANGCTDSDDIIIPPDAPVANLSVTQPPCYGDKGSIKIESVTGGAPPVTYSLNNAAPTVQNLFTGLSGGVYSLFVKDSRGCTTTAEVTIVEPPLFELTLTPDALIKIGESYLIKVASSILPSELQSVKWSPAYNLSCDSCLETTASPLKTSGYEIVAKNMNGCEDRAYIVIRVDTRLDIYVPNIFTPGGENGNNTFTIYTDKSKDIKIKTLQVFSRWGEKVFERNYFDPNLPELGWDGTLGGKMLNPAVFVWYAIIIGPDGNEMVLEGDITIER